MARLKLVWLQEGDLPFENLSSPWEYLSDEAHWTVGRSFRDKALVPITELSLNVVLEALGPKLKEPGTICIHLRTTLQMDAEGKWCSNGELFAPGELFVIGALAFTTDSLEGAFEAADPYPALWEFFLLSDNAESPTTPELRPAWERIRTHRRRSAEIAEAHHLAEGRARRLFLSSLDEEQRAEFDATERIFVLGQDGQQYLLLPGYHGNVFLVVDGMIVRSYCVAVTIEVPLWDSMMCQKLLLETDITDFLALANTEPVDPPIKAATARFKSLFTRIQNLRRDDAMGPRAGR